MPPRRLEHPDVRLTDPWDGSAVVGRPQAAAPPRAFLRASRTKPLPGQGASVATPASGRPVAGPRGQAGHDLGREQQAPAPPARSLLALVGPAGRDHDVLRRSDREKGRGP